MSIDYKNADALVELSNEVVNDQTYYKMENFVGNAELTPYKKMRQMLLELQTRQDAFLQVEHNLAKTKIELEIEEEKGKRATTELEKKYHALEIFNLNKNIRKYDNALKQALKEKDSVLRSLTELLDSDKGKLEDGTPLLDVIGNDELEEKLEAEYWTIRMAKQASTDMLCYGKIQTGNLDAIAMMPDQQQEETLKLVCDRVIRHDSGMRQLFAKAHEEAAKGIENKVTKTRLLSTGMAPNMMDAKKVAEELTQNAMLQSPQEPQPETLINSNNENSSAEFEMLTNVGGEFKKQGNN